MKDKQGLIESIERRLKSDYQVTLKEAAVSQLHDALGNEVMSDIAEGWYARDRKSVV